MSKNKKIKQKSRETQESKLSDAYLEAELWNKEREKEEKCVKINMILRYMIM